jgi:hypothetical protein
MCSRCAIGRRCVESKCVQEEADTRSLGVVKPCQEYVEGVKTALAGVGDDAEERTERSETGGQIICRFQNAWSAGLSMLRGVNPSASAIPVVCWTAIHSLNAT